MSGQVSTTVGDHVGIPGVVLLFSSTVIPFCLPALGERSLEYLLALVCLLWTARLTHNNQLNFDIRLGRFTLRLATHHHHHLLEF